MSNRHNSLLWAHPKFDMEKKEYTCLRPRLHMKLARLLLRRRRWRRRLYSCIAPKGTVRKLKSPGPWTHVGWRLSCRHWPFEVAVKNIKIRGHSRFESQTGHQVFTLQVKYLYISLIFPVPTTYLVLSTTYLVKECPLSHCFIILPNLI